MHSNKMQDSPDICCFSLRDIFSETERVLQKSTTTMASCFLQDLRIAKNVEYSQERLKGRKQLNRGGKQRLLLQWPVTNEIDRLLKSYLSFIFRLFSF